MRAAALLLLLPLLASCRPAERAGVLHLAYSALLKGSLDGCDCEHNRVAGLVKRAAYLRSQLPAGRLLLVDAGDILSESPDPDLALEILEVYRELGYAAVAVGENELAEGARELARYARRFPLFSHNSPLSPRPLLLSRGGLRVGIIALTDPELLQASRKLTSESLRFEDPIETARRMAEACRRKGAQLVLVLYHATEQRARRLAEGCPGLDLILFAHQGRLVPPEKIGSALIASPGENGNRLGLFSLKVGPRGIERFEHRFILFAYEKDPDEPGVRRRINSYRKKLQDRLRASDGLDR